MAETASHFINPGDENNIKCKGNAFRRFLLSTSFGKGITGLPSAVSIGSRPNLVEKHVTST